MARRSEEAATEAAEPKTPTSKPEPKRDDVLVYISRGHAIAAIWNAHLPKDNDASPRRGIQARIPQQFRVRLEPGLSFCPGSQWDLVEATPSVVQARDAAILRPVAGHVGGLEEGIAKIKPAALANMIDHSAHVTTLQRLQAIEEAGGQRTQVLEAIEARLDTLRVEVARSDRKRRNQRRAHRSRAGRAPNGAVPVRSGR